ncbi:hypothetical protein F5Y15DRAFT_195851 [Xylariaceae sp. FL0016]|nr:hypothetical protein F5Y15DRAFT_195851 [Xylariaceae sp. FL0016]
MYMRALSSRSTTTLLPSSIENYYILPSLFLSCIRFTLAVVFTGREKQHSTHSWAWRMFSTQVSWVENSIERDHNTLSRSISVYDLKYAVRRLSSEPYLTLTYLSSSDNHLGTCIHLGLGLGCYSTCRRKAKRQTVQLPSSTYPPQLCSGPLFAEEPGWSKGQPEIHHACQSVSTMFAIPQLIQSGLMRQCARKERRPSCLYMYRVIANCPQPYV